MKLSRSILCFLLAVLLIAGPAVSSHAAAAGSQDNPFADVDAGDWAYPYILRAYTEGLMTGTYVDAETGIREFSPDQILTMGEWSALMARIFYPGETNRRPETRLFAKEVAVLTLHNAYAGISDQDISTLISRYEMAQILYNIAADMGIPLPEKDEREDAEEAIQDWAQVPEQYRTAVASMFALEVFTGDDSGRFQGSRTLSRREAAVSVCQVLDKLLYSLAGTISDGGASLSITTNHWVTDYWSSLPQQLQDITNQDAFNCAAQTAADADLILSGPAYDGQFNSRYNYACYVCDVMQESTSNVIQAIQLCTGFCIGTGGSKSAGYVDYFSIATPSYPEEAQEAIDEILDTLEPEDTTREKVQKCIEAVCQRLTYKADTAATWESGTEGDSASFTSMLAELLLAAGIPSVRVDAECTGGPRSWLQICLSGSWYIADCLAAETGGGGILDFQAHVQGYGYPASVNETDTLQIARALVSHWPEA